MAASGIFANLCLQRNAYVPMAFTVVLTIVPGNLFSLYAVLCLRDVIIRLA